VPLPSPDAPVGGRVFEADGQPDLGLGVHRGEDRDVPMLRQQGVGEDVVADVVARPDALDRVEVPVNPQVDAALGVLPGHLAEGVVGTRQQRAGLAVLVHRDGVELVRDDR